MRLLGVLTGKGRRPRGNRKVARAFCVLACLILTPAFLYARGTPAGTQIQNTATVTFVDGNGNNFLVTSNTLIVTVGQVAGVDLEPPRFSVSDIGVTVVFPHTLENVGNGTDSYVVNAVSAAGWPVRLYLDTNQDGMLDAGDSQILGPIVLAADDTAHLLVAVDVPNNPAVRGTLEDIDVQATSAFDGAVSDALTDQIQVQDVGIVVSLNKGADRASAMVGDVITYTIDAAAAGLNTATGVQAFDLIPLGSTYVPGTLTLNGAPLTDASGDDAGHYDAVANQVVFQLGDMTGGDAGTLAFQVRAAGPSDIVNRAYALYGTIAGTDSVTSNQVTTTFVQPELLIQKDLTSANVAFVGDQVSYTLRYGNSSTTVTAQSVEVSDTLPIGLEYVSSVPPAAVNGQILTWAIGDVAPGDTTDIQLTVRVADLAQDTLMVANMAVVAATNALAAEVDVAEQVALVSLAADQLTIDKRADVLEVALGETAPYTIELDNTGAVPLTGIVVHDRIPKGGVYVDGSATSVDSVHVDNRNVTFFVAGPVDPGATHTIHYAVAIVSAQERTLANTAYATAENGSVESGQITAWIQVRSAWPMETRTAIGRVWIDLNDNGAQDPGEPGLRAADIWTDDGLVVSSDEDGKFSINNLRPGRHAFRLDPATVPLGYRLAGDDASGDFVTLIADGWTSPRINFRLVPRGTRFSHVYLPISWRFTARPLCTSLDEIIPSATRDRVTIAHFESNSARLQDGDALGRRVAQVLANRSDCQVELTGHADPRSLHGAPYFSNEALSRARADSVARALRESGYDTDRLQVTGRGTTQLLSEGRDPYSLWLNRRVELRLVDPNGDERGSTRSLVEYEVLIDNEYDVPLTGLAVRFEPAADSAVIVVDDTTRLSLVGHPALLPPIEPYARVTIRAWTMSAADSAVAVIERADRSTGRLAAAVHNYMIPVAGIDAVEASADTLPSPTQIQPGASVEVVLQPDAAGWPETTFQLPNGWELVQGSVKVDGLPAEDPEVSRDLGGGKLLYWRFRGRNLAPISLHLQPSSSAASVETVMLDPLRTADARQEEHKRAFIAGPAIEFFNPADGSVLRSDRLFVGVRGEPGRPVELFDGDSVIAEADIRVDGIHDFIAIPLARGPHTLRVKMTNSWGQERWDSLSVHVTGLPASIFTEQQKIEMLADGHTITTVRARVLDRWGVPLVNPTYVTVSAEGATLLGEDADRSSVGFQYRSDPAGWVQVDLRPGLETGVGHLALNAGEAAHDVELDIIPPSRPLMINGVGQVGVGSAPEAFGAITARGRIDSRTSVTLTYDSRRLNGGDDFFGRGYNPLQEAQYPLLADASHERVASASDYWFAARIERGFDFVALGDITTSDFSSGLLLSSYYRSLTGGVAHLTTGPIVWKGFGSSTTQTLNTLQIRGDGTSGLYTLQPNIRPGTEKIIIETRAADNAERVLTQQAMVRFIDYQIDYDNGTLLFKRPIPAADPYENPVFIMVSYEAQSGGERREVWGIRAAAGVEAGVVDSMRIGATYISDDRSAVGGTHRIAGADMRLLNYGNVDVTAELSYAQSRDSADFATEIDASLRLLDNHVRLWGGWMRVGPEYLNPANLALRPGTEEIRGGAGLRIGPSELVVEHEQQSFAQQQLKRERTSAGIVQSIGGAVQLDARLARDQYNTAGVLDESQAGEARLTINPTRDFSMFGEGRYQFKYAGNVVIPDYFGGGATYRVSPRLSLEGQYRQVIFDQDSLGYSIASVGVVTDLGLGMQAFGKYQIAGGVAGTRNAAIVGLNNRFRLGTAWSFNTLFERRFGLSEANILDPVRALPFLQNEEDYWSAGLGVELLPPDAPYRMSARGEYRDGDFRSSRLATLAGDVALNRSLAILARGDYLWSEQDGGGPLLRSERKAALAGIAFRPTGSDALNVLTKFEWLDETNPLGGGVLGAEGREQRIIGITEAIWAPFKWTELAGRYALRRTEYDRPIEAGETQTLTSWADYIGGRFNLYMTGWLELRSEGRLLIEHATDARRWDVAPSLVLIPINGFEIQGGYRFGDLWDPDFSVRGGEGWFVMFTARLTERVFPTSADFWRLRF